MYGCIHENGSSYDQNPTVDSRKGNPYHDYALKLDTWHPGWERDDLSRMAPGLAAEADKRLWPYGDDAAFSTNASTE